MIAQTYTLLFYLLPLTFFLQTRIPLFNQYYVSDYLIGFLYLREIVMGFFVLSCIINEFKRLLAWIWSLRLFLAPLVVVVICSYISSLFALEPKISFYRSSLLVLYLFFSLCFSYTIYYYHIRWYKWLFWWLVPFLLIGFMALWEFFFGRSLGLWILGNWDFSVLTFRIAKVTFWGTNLLRPYATFPHPNVLAAVSAIFLFIAIYVWRYAVIALRRQVALFMVGLLWFVVLISFSRSAWLALFVVGSTFLFYRYQGKTSIRPSTLTHLLVLGGGIVVLTLAGTYVGRLFSATEPSIYERVRLLEQSLEIINTNPLTGVGNGNFVLALTSELPKQPSIVFQPVHNVWFLVASEIGLIAAFFLVAFWVITVFFLLKIYFQKKDDSRFVLAVLIVFFVLITSQFDHYYWSLSIGQSVWWLVIALTWVVYNTNQKAYDSNRTENNSLH